MATSTYYSTFFPSTELVGKKGTTQAAVPSAVVGGIQTDIRDIKEVIQGIEEGGFNDFEPPARITGLFLTTSITTDNGSQIVGLFATWNKSDAEDLAGYDLQIKENAGNYVLFSTGKNDDSTATQTYQWSVRPNQTFTVQVRAKDRAGNVSAWSDAATTVSARDLTPPARPNIVAVQPTYNSANIIWSNGSEEDLDRAIIYLYNAAGVHIDSRRVSAAKGGGNVIYTSLTKGTAYKVAVELVDTSGNPSGASDLVSFTTVAGVDLNDFTPGLVVPKTVTELPNPVGYTGPAVVFFNGALYTYKDGKWTATNEIAPGSVDIDKLNLTLGGSNLLRNTLFEKTYAQDAKSIVPAGFYRYDNSGGVETISTSVQEGGRTRKFYTISFSGNSHTKGIYTDNAASVNNGGALKPNTKYVVSWYARGSGLALGKGMQLTYNYAPQLSKTLLNPGLDGQWRRFAYAITTHASLADGVHINLVASGNSPGILDICDIQVEEGDTLSSYSPAFLLGEVSERFIDNEAITETKISDDAISTRTIQASAITADEIRTDAIVARHVKAGEIIAGKLAAGAVLADNIVSKAITADKLVISNTTYLNPDSGFRDNSYWFNNGIPIEGHARPAYGGWYNYHGTDIDDLIGTTKYVMLWEANNIGGSRHHLSQPRQTTMSAGKTYELHAACRNASNQQIILYVRFFSRTQVHLKDEALVWEPGQWTGKSLQFTAPANTHSWEFILFNGAGSSFLGNAQVWDLQVQEALGSTVILPNAITTAKLNAGAVTADKILAGTITSVQIATDALTARVIAVGSPDNIVPDSDFKDVDWWGKPAGANWSVFDTTTPWRHFRRALNIGPGNFRGASSPSFTAEPGASYKLKVSTFISSDFNGWFNPTLHLPNRAWLSLKTFAAQADPDVSNSDSWVQGNYPGGDVYTQEFTFDNVNDAASRMWNFRFSGSWTAGTIEFAISIVRVSDTTLIRNGAVTTDKIIVNSLNGDRITTDTLDANKIRANSVLAGTITVSGTGQTVSSLGTTATWTGVSGTGKPADNATVGAPAGSYVNGVLAQTLTTDVYNIVSDGVISRAEKPQLIERWNNLYADWVYVRDAASALGVAYSDLDASFYAASAYLGVLSPGWSDLSADTPVDGGELRSRFNALVSNLAEVRRTTSNEASRKAQWTGVSGTGKPADNATVGAPTGTYVGGNLAQDVESWAYIGQQDPATRINANTTQIDPGRILISGGTTLASWRYGPDVTQINGGSIAANTITANKLTIGSRGVNVAGIDFYYDRPSGRLCWTGGHIFYTDEAGNAQAPYINAGSTDYLGTFTYVYWNKSSPNYLYVAGPNNWPAVRVNENCIMFCTWSGSYNFIPNFGGTVVDGDRITTGTIQANRLNVTSLSAISANIGLLRTAESGARTEIESNQIRVYDANRMRVRIGVW